MMVETGTPLWWAWVAWGFFVGMTVLSSVSVAAARENIGVWGSINALSMTGMILTTVILWGYVE